MSDWSDFTSLQFGSINQIGKYSNRTDLTLRTHVSSESVLDWSGILDQMTTLVRIECLNFTQTRNLPPYSEVAFRPLAALLLCFSKSILFPLHSWDKVLPLKLNTHITRKSADALLEPRQPFGYILPYLLFYILYIFFYFICFLRLWFNKSTQIHIPL